MEAPHPRPHLRPLRQRSCRRSRPLVPPSLAPFHHRCRTDSQLVPATFDARVSSLTRTLGSCGPLKCPLRRHHRPPTFVSPRCTHVYLMSLSSRERGPTHRLRPAPTHSPPAVVVSQMLACASQRLRSPTSLLCVAWLHRISRGHRPSADTVYTYALGPEIIMLNSEESAIPLLEKLSQKCSPLQICVLDHPLNPFTACSSH